MLGGRGGKIMWHYFFENQAILEEVDVGMFGARVGGAGKIR